MKKPEKVNYTIFRNGVIHRSSFEILKSKSVRSVVKNGVKKEKQQSSRTSEEERLRSDEKLAGAAT